MYLRQKRNKSGSTSVQIITKNSGRYKVLKTLGSSSEEQGIAMLLEQGRNEIRRLEKRIASGKLTKANINNRAYNKYLKLTGEIEITIDQDEFNQDQSWDGLKRYLTNCKQEPKIIIENYKNLRQIEKAFRMSKTDLRIRPIYHRLPRRIEAHICISFVAYSICKELERVLKAENFPLSVEKTA